MNDPWDVKSVRQSNQYMSCMKINGVPLLPPVLSRECRKEMQYYKLLAKEVEKRIQTLKPFTIESDTESIEDNTDAPDLPESEQSYELPAEANVMCDLDKSNTITKEASDVQGKISASNTFDNITSTLTDSVSSKFVIDLSLSINDTAKNMLDSVNTSQINDLPERDCECPKQKELLYEDDTSTIKDKLSFSVSINKEIVEPGATLHFSQEGPSSLSSKSFTGSLNDIHTESVKISPAPLIRQRSYTVLKPSPLLLAHLEVQSMNTGIDVTSISMSESLSNISYPNKKRRSWDLESAKEKWSSMAKELKGKNLINNSKNVVKSPVTKTITKKIPQTMPPKAKSLAQDRIKRSPPRTTTKSEPLQKQKTITTPVPNAHQSYVKATIQTNVQQKKEAEMTDKKPISETDDPATRVRELYEKIQKQQLIQMANLVEKQKKEQMLLQQVFEEQNNLLFTQLKTICPKSPNEVKEAWVDKNKNLDKGPVSLSQLINYKPSENNCDSPVVSTLRDTNNCIDYVDNILKKSRDITGSMIKPAKIAADEKKTDGSRTRTHSPVRKNTPTSRKLVYETSASTERDYDPMLTDRTNDTMADLNVTFPSDTEDCQPLLHNTVIMCGPLESPLPNSTVCRSPDATLRSVKQMQNSMSKMCNTRSKPTSMSRTPTAQERAAATKIVAHAKGFLVRRLMRTERVQATVQTIRDALLCALQLHQDREGIRGADVDLHRRLIQQITAACYSLHDTFIASCASERCALLAADRARQRSLAARMSPAPSLTPSPATSLPHRSHRPTDLMSQSHSGVFPARLKRASTSLMTQSNYETFSSAKSVRRYMPSPRRRPWR